MKPWQMLLRLASRFRHRVSLPEEVAAALGITLSNFITVEQLLLSLSNPNCCPINLKRYMPREEAEASFTCAVRVERFNRHTLCSYYFEDGWLEFALQFDEEQRLRRLYVHHKHLPEDHGVELPLRVSRRSPMTCHTQV